VWLHRAVQALKALIERELLPLESFKLYVSINEHRTSLSQEATADKTGTIRRQDLWELVPMILTHVFRLLILISAISIACAA
jgi:hypothetical protein